VTTRNGRPMDFRIGEIILQSVVSSMLSGRRGAFGQGRGGVSEEWDDCKDPKYLS
jgi:hypothetical protein